MKPSFFIGIILVVVVILIYSLSDEQINQGYLQKIETYRAKKDTTFLTDINSPLDKKQKKDFKGLSYYAPNLTYRIEADFIEFDIKEMIKLGTTRNGERDYIKFGKAVFRLEGITHELLLLQPAEKRTSTMFLAFTDETSGFETYGGGRYLDVEVKKGKAMIDFNYAYNPYCSYNAAYDCVLPLKENHLKVKIQAGEKTTQKDKQQ
jgi:uncharacterized protein (DUF1684 family)